MDTTTSITGRAPLTRLNKAGLALAGVLGLLDITAPFQPTPDGEVGPPLAILVLDGVLGVITVVAVVVAWRTRRRGPSGSAPAPGSSPPSPHSRRSSSMCRPASK